MAKQLAVLAFSGGLDTSFCVPWLQEQGYDVVTVTVDTGGFSAADLAQIEARAAELGVDRPPHSRRPPGPVGSAGRLHHQGQHAARRRLSALRGTRAAGAGDAGGRGGALLRRRPPSPTARPARATTRCASTSPFAC